MSENPLLQFNPADFVELSPKSVAFKTMLESLEKVIKDQISNQSLVPFIKLVFSCTEPSIVVNNNMVTLTQEKLKHVIEFIGENKLTSVLGIGEAYSFATLFIDNLASSVELDAVRKNFVGSFGVKFFNEQPTEQPVIPVAAPVVCSKPKDLAVEIITAMENDLSSLKKQKFVVNTPFSPHKCGSASQHGRSLAAAIFKKVITSF